MNVFSTISRPVLVKAILLLGLGLACPGSTKANMPIEANGPYPAKTTSLGKQLYNQLAHLMEYTVAELEFDRTGTFRNSSKIPTYEGFIGQTALATCSGNADVVISETGVTSSANALGAGDDTPAALHDVNDQIVLDLTDYLDAGASYTIRWRKNTTGTTAPSITVEESANGSSFTAAAGSPFSFSTTSYFNTTITAGTATRYLRFTNTNGGNLDLDAITFTNVDCCGSYPSYTTVTKTQGTCNGTTANNDASFTISGIVNADRADISTEGAVSYDGDDYSNAEVISGSSISFSGLQHSGTYIVKLFNGPSDCPLELTVITSEAPSDCPVVPALLPWAGSTCNTANIMLQNSVGALTCGVTETLAPEERYTFALMNFDGAVPASGRVEVTSSVEVFHHDSWRVDSIGNVFGTAINTRTGDIIITASTNYGAGFLGNNAVIRFGEIGGGNSTASNDAAAGGAVYKIDRTTGQASLFSLLPQQAVNFTNLDCESTDQVVRTNSGVGLGNIVYDETHDQFFVSNIEDGRIYRISSSGAILDSYDPFANDDGVAGISVMEELVYGLSIEPGTSNLFFGTVDTVIWSQNDFAPEGAPDVYSITLTASGGFPGTINNSTLPAGATYDNYEQTSETFHISIPTGSGASFGEGYVYLLTDMDFNENGQLFAAVRTGCQTSFFTSYNHWAELSRVDKNVGTQLYTDNIVELDITVQGDAAVEDVYGGVATYSDGSGNDFIAASSSDMLAESGPHGIAVFNDPPNTGSAITPMGAVSYGLSNNDPKGVGGDIDVFTACIVCPMDVTANDLVICAGESLDLDTLMTNVGASNADTAWFSSYAHAVANTNALGSSVVSPNTTTEYFVRLTDEFALDCYDIDSVTVTVAPPPSGITFSQTAPTCTAATANNDGIITLTAATDATHFGVSSLNAGTYDGPAFASAAAISLPQTVQSAIPNTGGSYIVRIFNGADDCYTDTSVTIGAVGCVLPCPVPNCGTATIIKN